MSDAFKQLFEQVVSGAAKGLIDAVNQMETSSGSRPHNNPPPPGAMIAWRSKLAELETSLSRFPHVIKALGEPASDSAIENANSSLGPFRLPFWLEELYRWHNGCDGNVGTLFELPFNSLEEALRNANTLNPFDYEFGFLREFTFPFLGVDDDWMLAVLDQTGADPDETLLYWHYHQSPVASHESPMAWIDELLRKLEGVDEDSFDDGGWFTGYRTDGFIAQRVPIPFEYGGVSAARWPPSYLQRAGITNHLITESELPPAAERRLVRGEPIPHTGPWEVYFGEIARHLFTSRRPKLPAQIRLETSHVGVGSPRNPNSSYLDCLLPEGILSNYTLRYGYDLDAVIWFRPSSLEADLPVIDKIRFPV